MRSTNKQVNYVHIEKLLSDQDSRKQQHSLPHPPHLTSKIVWRDERFQVFAAQKSHKGEDFPPPPPNCKHLHVGCFPPCCRCRRGALWANFPPFIPVTLIRPQESFRSVSACSVICQWYQMSHDNTGKNWIFFFEFTQLHYLNNLFFVQLNLKMFHKFKQFQSSIKLNLSNVQSSIKLSLSKKNFFFFSESFDIWY